MPWPLSQDYNEAIQSPAQCFADPELRQGEAVTDALGLPAPRSGNFADVYAVVTGQRKWAVKCFTRQIPGLQERYQQISLHLEEVKLPFMVDFTFLDRGIKVRGYWYPILKMQWVEGLTLNQFVKSNLDKPQLLDLLCQLWVKLAMRLREANIAHCDLQHGNVLLVAGERAGKLSVKLVDYDGMCVPSLTLLKSIEVGHPAYQHPQRQREGIYSLEVDRFSHLVIYTALRALMAGGKPLWDKYDDGDNLLFKPSDYAAPTKSRLFYEMLKSPSAEVSNLVDVMMQASSRPLEQTPLLEQVAGGLLMAELHRAGLLEQTPKVEQVTAPAPREAPPSIAVRKSDLPRLGILAEKTHGTGPDAIAGRAVDSDSMGEAGGLIVQVKMKANLKRTPERKRTKWPMALGIGVVAMLPAVLGALWAAGVFRMLTKDDVQVVQLNQPKKTSEKARASNKTSEKAGGPEETPDKPAGPDETPEKAAGSKVLPPQPVDPILSSPQPNATVVPAVDAVNKDAGQVLSPKEAAAKEHQKVTVEFLVQSMGRNGSGFWELYSAKEWRDADNFFIRFPEEVWSELQRRGVFEPGKYFRGKTIRVTGTVKTLQFNNVEGKWPVIYVDDLDQVEGLPKVPAADGQRPSGPKLVAGSADGFVQLFNGKELTNWKTDPSQPGNWRVVDGVLTGTGPEVSHLYTERGDYANFHLRAEARINDDGRSAIVFRAPFGGYYPTNTHHYPLGYEAQINSTHEDPNKTGSLYGYPDGTLVKVPESPIVPGDWFTLDIIAEGDHLVVKVNGKTTAEYTDKKRLYSKGHIALQQHDDQTKAEFRKIEIKELPATAADKAKTGPFSAPPPVPAGAADTAPAPPPAKPAPAPVSKSGPALEQAKASSEASAPKAAKEQGFVQLFNGKDLTGWKTHPSQPGKWRVVKGLLTGSGPTISHLFSVRGDYSDFHLRAEARINDGGDSGLFFRASSDLSVGRMPRGPEAHINNMANNRYRTGCLLGYQIGAVPRLRGSLVSPGEWFTLDVIAESNRTIVKVNGETTTDFRDEKGLFSSGHIALQQLGEQTVAEFRKIEINELNLPKVGRPKVAPGGGLTAQEKSLMPKLRGLRDDLRYLEKLYLVNIGKTIPLPLTGVSINLGNKGPSNNMGKIADVVDRVLANKEMNAQQKAAEVVETLNEKLGTKNEGGIWSIEVKATLVKLLEVKGYKRVLEKVSGSEIRAAGQ